MLFWKTCCELISPTSPVCAVSHMERNELWPRLQNRFKVDHRHKSERQPIKHLEENRELLCNFEIGNDFLPQKKKKKALTTYKMEKLDFIKINKFGA